MVQKNKVEDLSLKIQKALEKASKKVLAGQKALNSYIAVAGEDGKVVRIPARSL